jgi:hypothetical protein
MAHPGNNGNSYWEPRKTDKSNIRNPETCHLDAVGKLFYSPASRDLILLIPMPRVAIFPCVKQAPRQPYWGWIPIGIAEASGMMLGVFILYTGLSNPPIQQKFT